MAIARGDSRHDSGIFRPSETERRVMAPSQKIITYEHCDRMTYPKIMVAPTAKGGTGKSTILMMHAMELARRGFNVTVIGLDLNNIALEERILDVSPRDSHENIKKVMKEQYRRGTREWLNGMYKDRFADYICDLTDAVGTRGKLGIIFEGKGYEVNREAFTSRRVEHFENAFDDIAAQNPGNHILMLDVGGGRKVAERFPFLWGIRSPYDIMAIYIVNCDPSTQDAAMKYSQAAAAEARERFLKDSDLGDLAMSVFNRYRKSHSIADLSRVKVATKNGKYDRVVVSGREAQLRGIEMRDMTEAEIAKISPEEQAARRALASALRDYDLPGRMNSGLVVNSCFDDRENNKKAEDMAVDIHNSMRASMEIPYGIEYTDLGFMKLDTTIMNPNVNHSEDAARRVAASVNSLLRGYYKIEKRESAKDDR